MITQDLNTLKFNLMSNEKFEEKQANESLVENEIYLTPAPKVDSEPVENSKNLISSGAVFEALKNVPTGGIPSEGKSIQSDWAQTDSTQPDYIKNKPGDYQKDLREFNDITFENYAGTRPFYTWNNVLSNIDTLKDLDEGVILSVYQNGNLIDSQKFVLNPTLDSSFLPSSGQTGYWALINATKTTEEILGGSAWEEKNSDYSTFNMGFIKNDTTGIVYVIAGAPNDELVGQSFSFELDFTDTTKQLIKLPWEVISNKPGDISIKTFVDTYDLGAADDNDVTGDICAVMYQGCNLPTANSINVVLTHKTSGDIINLGPCELATGNFSGTEVIQGGFNTNTLFTDLVSGTATSFTRIDDTIPSGVIMFSEELLMTMIGIDIADYADYELIISGEEKNLIGLPEDTLGEEFLNIDGKLHLAYGKTQIETIKNETEASLTLETPLQQEGNPFLMWKAIYTIENYPYDLLKDKVQISYINSNNTQIVFDKERNPLLLELNSTLDQAFNLGPNLLGHWGIFNSKQTIMELFGQLQSGGNVTLEKYEENEPAVIVILSQSQEDRNIYITLVSLENIHEIYSNNFIINIINEQISETVLKLPKEALPDDISAEVEIVQSDYAENDETKDSYIQNRPFYDFPLQTNLFPQLFGQISWDGNVEGRPTLNNTSEGNNGMFKVSDDFIPYEKLESSIMTFIEGQEKVCAIAQIIESVTNQDTGAIGYQIGFDILGQGLELYLINEFPEAGTYLKDDGVSVIVPEAGIYFFNQEGSSTIQSWDGWIDVDHPDIIPELKEMGFIVKKISDEAPEREEWYGIPLTIAAPDDKLLSFGEYIISDIDQSVPKLPNSKKDNYICGGFLMGIKDSSYVFDFGEGNTYTFSAGLYALAGSNSYIPISYQFAHKIEKRYLYSTTIDTNNKIEEGNTKPISSGAVWRALGGRGFISIDNENLPQLGSQKLMTSNAIYNAFENVNQLIQNKQDTLTILDTVQENSDGVVKSSGIYNAIEEIKNDVPTATSQLTNDSNFIDESQLDSAVQEVMNVANGKRASYVFKDVNELNTFIASNQDSLKIGDIFLLTDTDLPDYWWTGSDVAVLETDIDLDNYYNQSQVNNLLSQKANAENHYTKTEIDSQFAQNLGGLMFRKAYSSQISNPTEGTIYYNTNDKTIQIYSGGSWSSAVAADPNTIYFVVEG